MAMPSDESSLLRNVLRGDVSLDVCIQWLCAAPGTPAPAALRARFGNPSRAVFSRLFSSFLHWQSSPLLSSYGAVASADAAMSSPGNLDTPQSKTAGQTGMSAVRRQLFAPQLSNPQQEPGDSDEAKVDDEADQQPALMRSVSSAARHPSKQYPYTHPYVLDAARRLLIVVLERRLVPCLAAELVFLARLAIVVRRNATKRNQEPKFFLFRDGRDCVDGLAAPVLAAVMPLLRHVGLSILEPLAQRSGNVELREAACAARPASTFGEEDSSFVSEDQDGERTHTQSKGFSTQTGVQIVNNRRKVLKAFAQLRQQLGPFPSGKARELVRTITLPANMPFLARELRLRLLEDVEDGERMMKLSGRMAQSSAAKREEFFQQFLSAVDSASLSHFFLADLTAHLSTLCSKPLSPERTTRLQRIARMIGYIVFGPMQPITALKTDAIARTPFEKFEQLLDDVASTRAAAWPLFPVHVYVEEACRRRCLVLVVPWAVAYLRMIHLDASAQRGPSFQRTLTALRSAYRQCQAGHGTSRGLFVCATHLEELQREMPLFDVSAASDEPARLCEKGEGKDCKEDVEDYVRTMLRALAVHAGADDSDRHRTHEAAVTDACPLYASVRGMDGPAAPPSPSKFRAAHVAPPPQTTNVTVTDAKRLVRPRALPEEPEESQVEQLMIKSFFQQVSAPLSGVLRLVQDTTTKNIDVVREQVTEAVRRAAYARVPKAKDFIGRRRRLEAMQENILADIRRDLSPGGAQFARFVACVDTAVPQAVRGLAPPDEREEVVAAAIKGLQRSLREPIAKAITRTTDDVVSKVRGKFVAETRKFTQAPPSRAADVQSEWDRLPPHVRKHWSVDPRSWHPRGDKRAPPSAFVSAVVRQWLDGGSDDGEDCGVVCVYGEEEETVLSVLLRTCALTDGLARAIALTVFRSESSDSRRLRFLLELCECGAISPLELEEMWFAEFYSVKECRPLVEAFHAAYHQRKRAPTYHPLQFSRLVLEVVETE